jgi:hypothetical protein
MLVGEFLPEILKVLPGHFNIAPVSSIFLNWQLAFALSLTLGADLLVERNDFGVTVIELLS